MKGLRWVWVVGFCLATLAGVATLLPFWNCPVCLGKAEPSKPNPDEFLDFPESWGVHCLACRDRGKVNLFGPPKRRVADSFIEAVVRRQEHWVGSEPWHNTLNLLFERSFLSHDQWAEPFPGFSYFPLIWHGFVRSEEGPYFAIWMSGNPSWFGPRHPENYGARVFLFSPEGRLLDRVDFEGIRMTEDNGVSLFAEALRPEDHEGAYFEIEAIQFQGESTPNPPGILVIHQGEMHRLSGGGPAAAELWVEGTVARVGVEDRKLKLLVPGTVPVPPLPGFSPRLRAAIPDLDLRLLKGGDGHWMYFFLEVTAPEFVDSEGKPYVTRKDLELLVDRAARGAWSEEDKHKMGEAALKWQLEAGIPALLVHAGDPKAGALHAMLLELALLRNTPRTHAAFRAVLESQRPEARSYAAGVLVRLDAPGAFIDVGRLLDDPDPNVRERMIEYMEGFAKQTFPGTGEARLQAARAWYLKTRGR